jgi:hypothetical protein
MVKLPVLGLFPSTAEISRCPEYQHLDYRNSGVKKKIHALSWETNVSHFTN